MRIGVSLSSTTEGGDFAVGTGSSLYGETAPEAADPAEVKPYAASAEVQKAPFVPSSRLSQQPRVKALRSPSYPESERREGIEGRVILRVRIDEKGKVEEVRLLRSLGPAFDELAITAMRSATFTPAYLDGAPVSTEIHYTFTFLLD